MIVWTHEVLCGLFAYLITSSTQNFKISANRKRSCPVHFRAVQPSHLQRQPFALTHRRLSLVGRRAEPVKMVNITDRIKEYAASFVRYISWRHPLTQLQYRGGDEEDAEYLSPYSTKRFSADRMQKTKRQVCEQGAAEVDTR